MAENINISKSPESQSENTPTKICKTCLRELPDTPEYFSQTRIHCRNCVNEKNRASRRVNGLTKRDLKNRENFTFDSDGNPVLRKCSRCQSWKPVDEFHNEKNGYLGKMSRCKKCFKSVSALRFKHNVENKIHVEKKICSKCGKEKPISEFHANKYSPDGKAVRCAECVRNHCKDYYNINLEHVKKRVNKYRNTPQGKKKKLEWERNNQDKRDIYRANPQTKETRKAWWKNNPEKSSEYRKKRRSTPKGALDARVGAHIRMGLKHGTMGKRWLSLIPYSLQDLHDHLDKTMPEGYTWEDYQDGKLHVDHKIPLAAFPYETPKNINFQKAWSLQNLQLLTATDNLKKWAKLDQPFQPYLGFELNEE